MRIVIVVEGETDRRVLERVLDDLREQVRFEFLVANGRDAGRPIALRLLLSPQTAVALVYDADTTDQDRVRAEQQALESYFRRSVGQNQFLVQPFVPELEGIFFEVPDALQSALHSQIDSERRVAAIYAPKKVLTELLSSAKIHDVVELLENFTANDLKNLRQVQALQTIRKFVTNAGTS